MDNWCDLFNLELSGTIDENDYPSLKKLREVLLSRYSKKSKQFQSVYSKSNGFLESKQSIQEELWLSPYQFITNMGDCWNGYYCEFGFSDIVTEINRLEIFTMDITGAYFLFLTLHLEGIPFSNLFSVNEELLCSLLEYYIDTELFEEYVDEPNDEKDWILEDAILLYQSLRTFPQEDSIGHDFLKGFLHLLGKPDIISCQNIYDNLDLLAYTLFLSNDIEYYVQMQTYSSKKIASYLKKKEEIPDGDILKQEIEAALRAFHSPLSKKDEENCHTLIFPNDEWYSIVRVAEENHTLSVHLFWTEAIQVLDQKIPLLLEKYSTNAVQMAT